MFIHRVVGCLSGCSWLITLDLLYWQDMTIPIFQSKNQRSFPRRCPPLFIFAVIILAFSGLQIASKFINATAYSGGSRALTSAASDINMSSPAGKSEPLQNVQMEGADEIPVKYIEVPSGREDATRYKAMKLHRDNNQEGKESDESIISIRSWMELVSSDNAAGQKAASGLTEIISSSPYPSLFFEVPGATWEQSSTVPFEFVLVRSNSLHSFAEGNPDRHSFEDQFRECLSEKEGNDNKDAPTCCSFDNLGGDARLVAPLPDPNKSNQNKTDDSKLSHIAIFMRSAPKHQIQQFWKLGASQYLSVLKEKHERGDGNGKTWFSTAGMGVAWLHLRLDSRPKYYSYDPFKS